MIDFKFWRNKRNLTRPKLAKMVNTSVNYIYEIETGKKFPSMQMMDKLVKALEISIIIRDLLECTCVCDKCDKACEMNTSKETQKAPD